MSELRLIFQKVGTAKYLSQLDVMRTFTRAFMRAGFPLKFSQGFNPHPRISVAYPLPVGVEGYAEIVSTRRTKWVRTRSGGLLRCSLRTLKP